MARAEIITVAKKAADAWRGTDAYHQAAQIIDMLVSELEGEPTLTPPNEWVKVMEAINNAAVAYIEGGPYDNDLPGMEFALKIDRLSRDFVRPPEEVLKDGSTTD